MADDVEKTTVDVGDGEGTGGEGSGKKGLNSMIVLGGIGLGAVVIGLVLALFVIKPMISGSDDPADEGDHVAVIEDSRGEAAGHGGAAASDNSGREKQARAGEARGGKSLIYAISDIVVNPAGTGGSRFLSCSFAFELGDAKLSAEFQVKDAIVRDALITILSSKTVPQLTDPKQREIVRYQIKKRISQLMQTENVVGVYFTDFVLQ